MTALEGRVVIGLVRYIAKRFEGIWRRGESDEPSEGNPNPTQPNPTPSYVLYINSPFRKHDPDRVFSTLRDLYKPPTLPFTAATDNRSS